MTVPHHPHLLPPLLHHLSAILPFPILLHSVTHFRTSVANSPRLSRKLRLSLPFFNFTLTPSALRNLTLPGHIINEPPTTLHFNHTGHVIAPQLLTAHPLYHSIVPTYLAVFFKASMGDTLDALPNATKIILVDGTLKHYDLKTPALSLSLRLTDHVLLPSHRTLAP